MKGEWYKEQGGRSNLCPWGDRSRKGARGGTEYLACKRLLDSIKTSGDGRTAMKKALMCFFMQ